MYNFVDTVEHSSSAGTLPAEAVSVNGKYIENVIQGYRTMYVTGRELLESEIKEQQIGYTDGTEYKGKRNVSRVITVTYRLMANTPEAFRQRFNALNLVLNQEQMKFVFNDEPDKYFIGTKSTIDEVPGGRLNVLRRSVQVLSGREDLQCCQKQQRDDGGNDSQQWHRSRPHRLHHNSQQRKRVHRDRDQGRSDPAGGCRRTGRSNPPEDRAAY